VFAGTLSEIYIRRLELADAEGTPRAARARAGVPEAVARGPARLVFHARSAAACAQAGDDGGRELGIDFGIFLEATDELVGRVQLSGIAPAPFESAYLGYSVSERHNGRGYAH
jgi:RimJ/RimL family protein N-acetyltransferase